MKKLSSSEIARLEAWAKTVGKSGLNMDGQQAMMVETVNRLSSNDWAGMRADENDDKIPTTQAEARKKLEKLKKKAI